MNNDNCNCAAQEWSQDDNVMFPPYTCESCYNKQQVEEHELWLYETYKEADINPLSIQPEQDAEDELPF